MNFNVAIDGPSGSGKGTTARFLAKRLGIRYLDTGAMYRALAIFLDRKGVTPLSLKREDLSGVNEISFDLNGDVLLNGENVEGFIRNSRIGVLASDFSKVSFVREFLVSRQKEIVSNKGYIAEGRDIGSVVIPDAELKIFLTCDIDERARRKLIDYRERGIETSFEEVLEEFKKRDENDSKREIAPLIVCEDAVLVDTSNISIEEQVDIIYKILRDRGLLD